MKKCDQQYPTMNISQLRGWLTLTMKQQQQWLSVSNNNNNEQQEAAVEMNTAKLGFVKEICFGQQTTQIGWRKEDLNCWKILKIWACFMEEWYSHSKMEIEIRTKIESESEAEDWIRDERNSHTNSETEHMQGLHLSMEH